MRPLRIRLTNFGPYKDQTIDFEDFNDAPLFLISGKTGSGKTTIFDAMCFALFGRSSGGDRNPEEMRSDFADHTEETCVTFIFEHKGQQYVITRKPRQILAKKRGEGTTEQQASVDLTVTGRDGQEQSWTKRRTVDEKLFDLLHLTPEQFTQIVLLPQGQFRHFLEANSNDKEALLADLFGTDLYKRWATQLNNQLKLMRQTAKDQSTQLATYAKMITWQDDQQPIGDAPITDVLTALTAQNDSMKPELAKRKEANEQATAKLTRLNTRLKSEANLVAVFDQQTHAQQVDKTLQQQAPAMITLSQRIKLLEWAQTVVPFETKQTETAAQVVTTTQRIQTAQAGLVTAQKELVATTQQLKIVTDQQDQEDGRQRELTQLQLVRPLFEAVAKLTQQQKTQQHQVNQAQSQVDQLNRELVTQQQLDTKLNAQLSELKGLDAQQMALRDQQHELANIDKQQHELEQQQTSITDQESRIAAIRQQLVDAEDAQQLASTKYAQLDHDWTVGQIQRLSAKLTDGEPCPVCGSTEHPRVAVVTAVTVSEDELKTADQTRQTANATVAKLEGQLRELEVTQRTSQATFKVASKTWRETVAKLVEQKITAKTVEQVLVDFKGQLNVKAKGVSEKLDQREIAQKALAQVKTDIDAVTDKMKAANTTLQKSTTTLTATTTQLRDRQQDVPTEFASLAVLDAHIVDVNKASDAFTKALETGEKVHEEAQTAVTTYQTQVGSLQTDLEQQQINLKSTTEAFEQKLQNYDAPVTSDEFKQLSGELSQLQDDRKQHQTYLDARTRVTAQLETFAEQIDGQAKPDIAVTTKQRDEQAVKQATVQKDFYDCQQLLQHNTDLGKQIGDVLVTSRQAQQRLADMAELADTANGKSDLHLSLERYILQTYLQQVLQVANVRLAILTGKRYQFRLNTEAGSHATDTGLEIDVFDDQAGKVRSVHTLSGGESFIAALSLALALGEVIQSEAGGISIEALFVDEGFGSLDGEALQMAMEALQTIEGQNRMIGIISHVTELQEQIPDQLKVIALANGQSKVAYQHEL